MAKFDNTHCEAGRKVLLGLLAANGYSRGVLAPDVASGINAELQLSPENPTSWSPEDVKCAVKSKAFDLPGQHEFDFFRGRAGGICEVAIADAPEAPATAAA